MRWAETIRTSRLSLVPLSPSDASEMVDVLADPVLYVFTGGEPPDLVTLEERYRNQVAGPIDGSETWFNWIVRRADDGSAVGFVQATIVDYTADLAWVLGVRFQGHGYAVEAAGAMRDWLANEGFHRLTAHIHPAHVASQRVARAIGLTRSDEIDDDGEQIWFDPSNDNLTLRRAQPGDE